MSKSDAFQIFEKCGEIYLNYYKKGLSNNEIQEGLNKLSLSIAYLISSYFGSVLEAKISKINNNNQESIATVVSDFLFENLDSMLELRILKYVYD